MCNCDCECKCCEPPITAYGADAFDNFAPVVGGSICAAHASRGFPFDFDDVNRVGGYTVNPDGSFTIDTSTGVAGFVGVYRSISEIEAGKGGRIDVVRRPYFMATSQLIVAFQDANRAVASGFSGSEGVLLRPTGELSFEPYYGASAPRLSSEPCDKLSIVSDGSRIWFEQNDEEVFTYPTGHDALMYAYIGFVSGDPNELFDIKVTVNP